MASKKLWKYNLNPQQIEFCENYVSKEMFMNGTRAYMGAYKDCTENTARVNASILLTNTNVLNYIDSLIDDSKLDDDRVDKELKKLVLQDDEKNVKLWAMKMYNDLKARVEKGKQKALNDGEISESVLWTLSTKELESIAYGKESKTKS